jgi:hypothetical protein
MSEFKVVSIGREHYVYKYNDNGPGTYLTNTGQVKKIDFEDSLYQFYFPSHEAAQAALDSYLNKTSPTTILVDGKPIYTGPVPNSIEVRSDIADGVIRVLKFDKRIYFD